MNDEVKLLEAPKCRCDFSGIDLERGKIELCNKPAKPRLWKNFMTGENEIRNLCDTHMEGFQLLLESLIEFSNMIEAGIDERVAINTIGRKIKPFADKNF